MCAKTGADKHENRKCKADFHKIFYPYFASGQTWIFGVNIAACLLLENWFWQLLFLPDRPLFLPKIISDTDTDLFPLKT